MNNQWNSVADRLYSIREERKRYEELEMELHRRLVLLSKNETAIGDRYVFLKDSRKGSIEYSLIPELMNVSLDKYRKPDVTVWKLSEK